MNRCLKFVVGMFVSCLAWVAWSRAAAEEPRIVSVQKIWDRGPHNAFTDLIRWRGKWYCTFREADGHVGGDGKLRVLESSDGETWTPIALVAEDGIDLRDPKLSVTPDDRLMIVAGGSVYGGTKTLKGRQPRVAFSQDGRAWSAPQRVLTEGEWLWRVTWHDGTAYGVAYNASARQTQDAQEAAKSSKPAPPGPADWKLKLVASDNGTDYQLLTHLDVPGHPNETTLRFLPGGELMALVRREGGNTFGWIGSSRPPYRAWTWHETKHRLGGPNFIRLPDGSLWAGSRLHPGGPKTTLARLTRESYEPALLLPSGGDTSYPGLVWDDGLLWMSYYSSHEGKSSIYLAKIRLPQRNAVDAPAAAPPAAVDIGSRLELFVDRQLVDRLSGGAALELQKPAPHDVALIADRSWEGNTSAYYTVFRDGDLFRMYYRGSHFDEKTRRETHREVACYAESKDGIRFTKPDLGIVEFEGSKQNNIVWDGVHNFAPFQDTNPRCAAGARYKALASGGGGLVAFQSADAIHWSRMGDKPVITRGAFDSQNLAFWDSHIGKYRDYHRGFRNGVRDIMTCTSDDFVHWTDPVFIECAGAPREHLYTNAIRPYERAPHLLIGFPTRFLPAREQTEPTFMASRDGQTFFRWADAVIPTTAPADRDGNRSNYMAWGLVQLPGRDNEWSVYAKEAYYTGPGSRVRRFTYRVDGFVAARAPAAGGELITKPICFTGNSLVVNFVTRPAGSLRVELQDAGGKPLDGLSLAACAPLRGDSIAQGVAWKDGAAAGRWAGKPVRLRFELKDADLFSFRFE
jgi:hypothetical protein